MQEQYDKYAPDNFQAELRRLEKQDFPDIPPQSNIVKDTHDSLPSDEMMDQHDSSEQPESETESQEQSVSTENESETQVRQSHMIPKSRLDKELRQRKTLEKELQEERESRIRVQTQMEMLQNMQHLQAQQPQPKHQEPQIDPLDPEAFNYTHQKLAQLERQLEEATRNNQEFMRDQQYRSIAVAQENAFLAKNPDYMDAFEHVRTVERNVLESIMGDSAKAEQAVQKKIADLVRFTVDSGKNPAEAIYNMAKSYGYKAGKATQQGIKKPDVETLRRTNMSTANASAITNTGSMNPYQRVPVSQMLDSNNEVKADVFRKELEKLSRQHVDRY